MGEDEEATVRTLTAHRHVMDALIRINPSFSLEEWAQRTPFKDPTVTERYVTALRKAGLK